MPTHAVTWIDHKEARIFHLHPDATDETTILAPQHHLHRHPLGLGDVRGSAEDARRFFKEVARTLEGADALLIVGPSSAKLEFFRYLHEHDRHLEAKVVASSPRIIRPTERSSRAPGAASPKAIEWVRERT